MGHCDSVTVALCVICIAGCGGSATTDARPGKERIVMSRDHGPAPTPMFVKMKVKGPSSVAFHRERATLLVASDDGYVAELDEDLERIERYKTKGDLEGIAVHPTTGRVYLASERESAVLELDLDSRRVVRTLVIDFNSHPELEDKKGDNRGIEGVAFVPADDGKHRLFAALQSDPARLLELEERAGSDAKLSKTMRKGVRDRIKSAKKLHGELQILYVKDVVDLDLKPLSDVVFEPRLDALVIVSSKQKRALLYDPITRQVLNQFALPGKTPEGLVFFDDGRLLVVDDAGGAWWIDNARRWMEANGV